MHVNTTAYQSAYILPPQVVLEFFRHLTFSGTGVFGWLMNHFMGILSRNNPDNIIYLWLWIALDSRIPSFRDTRIRVSR